MHPFQKKPYPDIALESSVKYRKDGNNDKRRQNGGEDTEQNSWNSGQLIADNNDYEVRYPIYSILEERKGE